MGLLTFDGFKAEVRTALGRSLPTAALERWVNFGYYELCSDVDFEKLDENFPILLGIGTREYTYTPVDTPVHLGIKLVWDEDQRKKLDFLPKQSMYGLEPYNGPPKYWTLDRNIFIVFPTPIAANTLRVVYKRPPTALTDAGHQTILPATWDRGVVLAAVKHGFLMVDEFEKAVIFGQEYARYISTRITEDTTEKKMMEAYPPTKMEMAK